MDPVFAAGVRRALVERPSLNRFHLLSRSRRTWLAGGLTVALLGTAGGATAVLLTQPGGQMVTELSAPVTVSGSGNGILELGESPKGANAVQYEFTCLTPGSFMVGRPGPSFDCGKEDINARSATSGGNQVPLDMVRGGSLAVVAGEGHEWQVTAEYVATKIAPLAINANGETYGSDAFGAQPDLISAMATNGVEGYVRQSDLDVAMGPMPTSPTQAIEMQNARQHGPAFSPVYKSYGVTVVGEFETQR